MTNSNASPAATLTILHTFDGQTFLLNASTLPDGETPEMLRFVDCARVCQEIGFVGCSLNQFQRTDDTFLYDWTFDVGKPAGRVLHNIYLLAERGVMPPDPKKVVAMIQGAMQ